MTEEDMRISATRRLGFDVYGLIDSIREHTAWLKSLPPERAEAEKLKEMIAAGIWDENGQLTEPYKRRAD
jgi:erythromycin esterase-like protein